MEKNGGFLSHEGTPIAGCFFPTCQVRVVRFYQSCSSPSPPLPPRPPPPPPPLPPLPCSLPPCQLFPKLFASFRTQWAPLASTWDLPSSVSTAEHCWTSTSDHPSSVSTAGPQPGTWAQWAPLALNGQIECQKICQIERQIECQKECQKICQIKCQNVCQIECQKICEIKCQKICQIECQKICQKSARRYARWWG